jgi:hypothetical protein
VFSTAELIAQAEPVSIELDYGNFDLLPGWSGRNS